MSLFLQFLCTPYLSPAYHEASLRIILEQLWTLFRSTLGDDELLIPFHFDFGPLSSFTENNRTSGLSC